ncbi:MAG: clostripain-related cysteine peptidase [Coriobacteriales bacterium]|nr:clostripain-related cysteine peptidase [Coriobacteriales bacterium]
MVSHRSGFIGAHQGARDATSRLLPTGRRARRLRGVALLACFLCCACLVLSACGQALRSDTCTIFLYMCGSNLESEQGIASKNIDELLKANVPSNVRVVLQTGGSTEWKSHNISANKLQRYEVRNHKLELIEEQANASMGEGSTLRDFISWGASNYWSDRNMLVLWDHGSKSADKICFDSNYNYSALDSIEIKNVLAGVKLPSTYDMVIYDACFMATVDNAYLMHDYADYMVASQEMVPSGGLDYEALVNDCGVYDTDELGQHICDAYFQKCENNGKQATAEISLMNLSQTEKFVKSLDKLCTELVTVQKNSEGTSIIEGAANMSAQFGSKSISNVVDLGLFSLIATSYVPEFDTGDFEKLYEAFVPYKKIGESSYNTGASIYFPVNYEKKEFSAYTSLCPIKHYVTLLKNIFSSSSAGITLQDKGSIASDGSFTASLTKQSHDCLLAVSFELYKQDKRDVNKYTYVGTSMNVRRNEEDLSYSSNFEPVWPALNGQVLTTSVYMSLPDSVVYAAPVVVNGKDAQLLVPYEYGGDYASGQYDECVLWGGFTENGMADKNYGSLKSGDVVATYEATDESGDELTPRATFTVSDNSKVENVALEDGTYGYRFVFDDVLGKDVKSNMALFEVKGGQAKLVSVVER